MAKRTDSVTMHADLSSAILEGSFEDPPWGTFLNLLREVTSAEHVTMIFRPPGRPFSDAMHLYSGSLDPSGIRQTYGSHLPTLNLLNEQGLIEGRVYSFDEVYPPEHPEGLSFFNEVIVPSGVNASRIIRVTETGGVSAWLTISRKGDDFGERDDALLKSLAPLVRGSLRFYLALEAERFKSSLARHVMRSLYFSWLTLSSDGEIIDYDPEMDEVFKRSGVIYRSSSGRLRATSAKIERELRATIARLAQDPQARPYALTLEQDPLLDMLLIRASDSKFSANQKAEVVAYVHGDSWRSTERHSQLAELFGLTPSEARLTLVLSRGTSPTDAAKELGLSVETVRSYIKVIYYKTGARGIADLVRIVMRSVLVFAPGR